MRTPPGVLLVLLAFFFQSGLSQPQGSSLPSMISQLPLCVLQCLKTAVRASPCEITDEMCIVSNEKLNTDVEACMMQTSTKKATQSMCGALERDRSNVLRITNITLGVTSAAFVLVRIIYKLVVTASELGWDDYAVTIVLVSGVSNTVIIDRALLPSGLGKDIWTLDSERITDSIYFIYVIEIIYLFQVSALKLSLLYFYHRIFPGKPVRKVILATGVFNTLFGIAFVLAAVFQCQPISFFWNGWDREHTGQCVDINALAWANAAISISLDLWMLAIPLSQLYHLQMSLNKKLGVAAMFCVGTFITVVSIVRLKFLVHFANSADPTWSQLDTILWSDIEINVGVICVCMPSMRVILVHIFPKVFGSTRNASSKDRAKYGSHRGYKAESGGRSHSSQASEMVPDSIVVKYTKTFELQHVDKHNDEIELVNLNKIRTSSSYKAKSGDSSEISL